jgi:hypothetical protein
LGDISPTRWWEQKRESAAEAVFGIAKTLHQDATGRRSRALRALGLFEGRELAALTPLVYSRSTPQEELVWNIPRSLCLTVQAKIAGRSKPKPQFLTTDADYRTARRATKLDRFVEAQLHERQGIYESAWDLTIDVFLDAAIFGMGVIKVSANADEKRVQLERIFPWEILVDPLEAAYGKPLNLFHVYPYDRDALKARYPKQAKAIEDAGGFDWDGDDVVHLSHAHNARIANQVRIVEPFRLPISSEKPGKHAITVANQVLEWEDYERPEYPFIFLRWSKERMGFYATGLVEEVECIAREINFTLERMRDAENLNAPVIVAKSGTLTKPEQVESNENWTLIEHDGDVPPQFIAPQAYSESTLKWLTMHEEHAFTLSGISQLVASARKEKGITSGLALRTLDDQQSERLAVIDGQYEQLFPALARHIVWCTRELYEDDPSLMAKWPGQGFLREIKFSDVDIPENAYVVQIDKSNSITRMFAGRISTGQDLYNAGIISKDAFLRITQVGDVDREVNALQAQYSYIADLIDRYLDLTPEELDEDPGLYEVPEPFLIHELAMVQFGQAYLEWKARTRSPKQRVEAEFNLELLRRFIEACDVEIQRKQAKLAQAQASGASAAAQPGVAAIGMGAAPAAATASPGMSNAGMLQ